MRFSTLLRTSSQAVSIACSNAKRSAEPWLFTTTPFSPAVLFLGETTLLQSVWRVASARDLHVHVEVLPPMASAHADRRQLAQHLQDTLQQRLTS